MPQSFNYERAASALVDAIFMGDKAAAEKWGVSTRSIEGWRSRLNEDARLAGLFQQKKKAREKTWASEIPETIQLGLKFIQDATKEANPADPDAIKAIADAMKVLMEIDLTKQILDARMAEMVDIH
ncbi:hypothetical protein ACE1AT_04655 [Pelatocladus sp. BLCC-F211]|uniref:hypothetical protein n=1 Tax=Pelatocladus sp. BLCC-F211 TaxID=3342752 RepID=UPI0035B8A801